MRSENKVRGCFVGLENRGNRETKDDNKMRRELKQPAARAKIDKVTAARGLRRIEDKNNTEENARRAANKAQELCLHESSKYYGVSISTVGFEHCFNQNKNRQYC